MLYFLRWANEFLIDGHVVSQDATFSNLVTRFRSWLGTRFTSARGEGTFDHRGEYERLKGGW
jgi:hypothetical protein